MPEELREFSADKEVLEAEKALLSCFFFYYGDVEDVLAVESVPEHLLVTRPAKRILQALKESPRRNNQYDSVDVAQVLKRICTSAKEFNESEKYLSNLSRNIHYYYANEYRKTLRAFHIKQGANEVARTILGTMTDSERIDGQMINWIKRLDELCSTGIDVVSQSMSDAWAAWELEIMNARNLSSKHFLKTRYDGIDSKIKSLGPGQLIVIASRPGVGKTTFALNIMANNFGYVNLGDNPEAGAIGVFSLEMTTTSLLNKIISINSSCPLSTIQKLSEGEQIEDWEQNIINKAVSNMGNLNILFCDDANIDFGKIASTVKHWYRQHNLKLVIIDYLQLVNVPSEGRGSDNTQQYQKIGMISRNLKILAMELNICILSLAQLNRKVEERRGPEKAPILSDLRESGSIEQDADVVMFLYEAAAEEGDMDSDDAPHQEGGRRQMSTMLKIAKNRHGPVGTIEFFFDKTRGIYKAIGER